MGLASFNRMRLRRIEEMKPENITKEVKETKEKLVQVEDTQPKAVNKPVEVEKPKEEIKETATRGSKRKK